MAAIIAHISLKELVGIT